MPQHHFVPYSQTHTNKTLSLSLPAQTPFFLRSIILSVFAHLRLFSLSLSLSDPLKHEHTLSNAAAATAAAAAATSLLEAS